MRGWKIVCLGLIMAVFMGTGEAQAGLLKRDPEKKSARKARKAAKKEVKAASKVHGSGDKFSKALWKEFVDQAAMYGLTQEKKLSPGPDLVALARKVNADPLGLALVQAGLCKKFRRLQFLNVKTPLSHPKRIYFARKSGELVGTLGKTWIHPEPYELDEIGFTFEKLGGKGKAEVYVYAHRPSGKHELLWSFEVPKGDGNVGKVWEKRIGKVRNAILSVVVDGKTVARSIEYRLRFKRPGQAVVHAPKRNGPRPVKAFADIHAHMLSCYGFGGRSTWPSPFDRPRRGSKGSCPGKHECYDYKHDCWPHCMDSSHQQFYGPWLKRALDSKPSLGLFVVACVSNEFLGTINETLAKGGKAFALASKLGLPVEAYGKLVAKGGLPVDDMDSMRLQLRALAAFARKHPWFVLVGDPWEARRVIASGKLAVVPAIECSNLFPKEHGLWKDQLQEFWHLGLRSLEIVHETDSRFSGAAIHHPWTMKLSQGLNTLSKLGKLDEAGERVRKHWQLMKGNRNPVGLKAEGKELLQELARKHMLIEVDHASRAARKEIYDFVAKGMQYYPLYFSHSRYDELMPSKETMLAMTGRKMALFNEGTDSKATTMEYMAADWEIPFIKKTGGVFGLRCGPNTILKAKGCPVANSCHGSTRSLAQLVWHGQKNFGIAQSLGTDMGAPHCATVAPRYGPEAGCKHPKSKADTDRPIGKCDHFDLKGFTDVGYEPEMLRDLEKLELDVSRMKNSAETFIRMWERCYDGGRKALDDGAYARYMFQGLPRN